MRLDFAVLGLNMVTVPCLLCDERQVALTFLRLSWEKDYDFGR